jgi:hypothetical protein
MQLLEAALLLLGADQVEGDETNDRGDRGMVLTLLQISRASSAHSYVGLPLRTTDRIFCRNLMITRA